MCCAPNRVPRVRARGSPVSARAVPPRSDCPSFTGPVLPSLRSARKGRFQQDPRGRWLKAAILLLLSAAAGGGLVVWSRLGAEDAIPEGGTPGDGVTEVLAHRSDNLRDKFIEIPCSEDYDSHKRFEGNWTGLSEAEAVLRGQEQPGCCLGLGTKLGLQNSRVCSKLLVAVS